MKTNNNGVAQKKRIIFIIDDAVGNPFAIRNEKTAASSTTPRFLYKKNFPFNSISQLIKNYGTA